MLFLFTVKCHEQSVAQVTLLPRTHLEGSGVYWKFCHFWSFSDGHQKFLFAQICISSNLLMVVSQGCCCSCLTLSLDKSFVVWAARIPNSQALFSHRKHWTTTLSFVLLHPPASFPCTLPFSPKCIFPSAGCQTCLKLQLKEKIP